MTATVITCSILLARALWRQWADMKSVKSVLVLDLKRGVYEVIVWLLNARSRLHCWGSACAMLMPYRQPTVEVLSRRGAASTKAHHYPCRSVALGAINVSGGARIQHNRGTVGLLTVAADADVVLLNIELQAHGFLLEWQQGGALFGRYVEHG